ncbi:MAG: ClpXP protease specificity-enhancing factor SspB [Hyphomicrobiales bacterium]
MNPDLIGYNKLMNKAMINVIIDVLSFIKDRNHIPGEHHLYISFATKHKGVIIPKQLKERFPDKMTIVLQHQFQDLEIKESYFSVTLHFDNIPEKITIPYDAITSFYDPSVNFGIDFLAQNDSTTESKINDVEEKIVSDNRDTSIKKQNIPLEEKKSAEVVSLSEFKK